MTNKNLYENLKKLVPKTTHLVTKKFSKRRKWFWILILVLYQCLGISATEDVDVTPDTIAAELGDDVNLPCQVNSSIKDQIVWIHNTKRRILSENGVFIINNVTEADKGTYSCYYEEQLLGKFNLIVREQLPYLESNSAHFNSEDSSDADYLRVLGISTAISIFALVTLISGIALLLIKHKSKRKQVHQLKDSPGEDESLELVPNITLNPSFNIDMLEHIEPEYNENSEHTFLVESPERPTR